MEDFIVDIIEDDFSIREAIVPGAAIGSKPEYPSDWFRKYPAAKPPLIIPPPIQDADLWKRMLGFALTTSVTPNLAIRFLYEYVTENYSAKLETRWSSYGTVIGDQGQVITPMDILRVNTNASVINGAEGNPPDDLGKFRLFAILIAGYRYGIASEILQGDYKATVLGKINQVLRNEPYNLDSDLTPTEMMRCKSWYNNAEFRVIVAALDMFWNRFPDSEGAKLRVCTLNSRFKDCTSISEMRHLSKITCRPIRDVMRYIFSTKVKDEVDRITRPGEEGTNELSYFPYMREMRLSWKSPYSSTENVHLHNWMQYSDH